MEDFPPPPSNEFLNNEININSTFDTHTKLITPYAANSICLNNPAHLDFSESELKLNEALNILVNNLDKGHAVQNFCTICSKEIFDFDNMVSAIEKVFHHQCFKCFICDETLVDKTFYYVKNLLYCEKDYMNTLEKCSMCKLSIHGKILRATGKPYHPSCFVCSTCGKCLDGIPFTLDASNQIYCIPDFHNKYAPKCVKCKQLILPEKDRNETLRIIAMDKNFHVDCFTCQDCGVALASSNGDNFKCYPLDDIILCKTCNCNRINNITG